ncbi:unnamed protein product, partial [Staurois parvus]
DFAFPGGRSFCLQTIFLPVSLSTLLGIAVHRTVFSAYSEEHTPRPLVKHTQHTINPLIAPHNNPFLPSAISIVSVLFLALITVLVSLEMSVTPS